MKIRIKIAFLLITVMSLSCENYLEEEPPTFISATNFWQTPEDARTAVNGVYKKMNDVHNRWWPVVDAFTDDSVTRTQGGPYNEFGTHTLTPSNTVIEDYGVYNNWWIGIGRANNVLKFVPGIDFGEDEAEKNIVLGEARALRAYFYYQLVRTFGDMPLIVNATVSDEDFMLPRSSVDDVYNEIIIPDLEFAEENCRDGLHTGHITKWMAKLLLSEVYLTRAGWRRTSQGEFVQGDASNWALARDKAKEVIDLAPNSLNLVGNGDTPAYGMAWGDDSNPFTNESMLEISYVPVDGLGNWMSRESNPGSFGSPYWGLVSSVPLTDEGNTFTVRQLDFPGGIPNQGLQLPTPDLWDEFEDGDERIWSLMTRYDTDSGETYLCQPTFRKLIDIALYLGEDGTSFRYTDSNVVLYRFADALLIYAEAQNEADGAPSPEAYNAINRLRNRAALGDLPTGLSQTDFRTAVWHERRVELNAEFKRRFDLIRTNRLTTETALFNLDWTIAQGALSDYYSCYTIFYNTRPAWTDNEWLFPIPQSQIELNAENGWEQNQGYIR